MYLNSNILTIRRVPPVEIRILTSREQCGDQSVRLKHWTQIKTRIRSRSQIPTLNSFTHPAPPSPTPGAWPQQRNENSVQYVFYLLFVRTHTKFGIKILELTWWSKFNDILPFDLTQSHQFDLRMKILLAFCSARHLRRFDMQHDHVWKKKTYDMFCIFHLWEHTQSLFKKIFEIDFVIEINDIWPFDPSPGPQGVGPKKGLTLHAPFMCVTHIEFRPMV